MSTQIQNSINLVYVIEMTQTVMSVPSQRLLFLSAPKRLYSQTDTDLKSILAAKIAQKREKVKWFRQKHAAHKVSDVTVSSLYGGMRDVQGVVCETSMVDPEEGVRFRGLSIPEIRKALPKAGKGKEPLPEGMLWLLLTGDVPSDEQVGTLSRQLAERGEAPRYLPKLIKAFPPKLHPLAQLCGACNAMSSDSKFSTAYSLGATKSQYWSFFYEDALDLIAKLPAVAAGIYHNLHQGPHSGGNIDCSKDWSYNFANLLGLSECEFLELLRLFLTIYSDHGGGNVPSHTVHLVGSTLADPYATYASGIAGLSGPLYGLGSQEAVTWIKKLKKQIGDICSEETIKLIVIKQIKSGQAIPGFGNLILRRPDPRYICLKEFATKHLTRDLDFILVSELEKIVPVILAEFGQFQNPFPNADLISGTMWKHYGLKHAKYYPVLLAVSRALGTLASLVWDRALEHPLKRPMSVTSEALMRSVVAETNPIKAGFWLSALYG